jgi:hypothetical protein
MMNSVPTYEAPISVEEQVHVHVSQMTDGVKCMTVHCNRDSRREGQILIEYMPVGMMVQKHDTKNTILSLSLLHPLNP